MRYQSKKATCGPNSLQNALELLGIKRSEDELSKLCNTGKNGTDERGILAACAGIGVKATEIRLPKSNGYNAVAALHYELCMGRPVICCVDNWQHWVVSAGFLGDSFLCIDGASDDGLLVYKESSFLTRWEHPRYGYFAISVGG